MLTIFDIKDLIRTMLEDAENYNHTDAPIHYSSGKSDAWLAGRVAVLQRLDDMMQNSKLNFEEIEYRKH